MPFDFLFSATGGASGPIPTNFAGSGSPGASVTITKTEGLLVEPASVVLEATGLSGFTLSTGNPADYNEEIHDLEYFWYCAGLAGQDYANYGGSRMPANWRSRAHKFSKTCSFTLPAGTHTIQLWVHDASGNWAYATTSVTVATVAATFSGAQLICYAADGNFTGKPSGATQVTSVAALSTAVATAKAAGAYAVLFKRGEEHTDFTFAFPSGSNNFHCGAWGTGARPIFKPVRDGHVFYVSENANGPLKRSFNDLVFKTSWDAATETGSKDEGGISLIISGADAGNGYFQSHYNCDFDGAHFVQVNTAKTIATTTVYEDCRVPSFSDYGILTFGGSVASLCVWNGGCLERPANACQGCFDDNSFATRTDGFNINMSNEQGPFRSGSRVNFVFAAMYMFCNTSWAGRDEGQGIRISNNNPAKFLLFDRFVFEGGDGFGVEANPCAAVMMNRAIFLETAHTRTAVGFDSGNLSFKNIYISATDVTSFKSYQDWFAHDGNSNSYPIRLRNVSVYDPTASGPSELVDTTLSANFPVSAANTWWHAPSQSKNTGAVTTFTVDGLTRKYTGQRRSMGKPSVSPGSTTANGASITFPYPKAQDGTTNTTSANYAATGANARHSIYFEGSNARYYREDGDFTITFGASNITVTNTSGDTWPNQSVRLGAEYLNYTDDSSGPTLQTVVLAVPASGNSGFNAASGARSFYDLLNFAKRPGSGMSGAPAGTADQGAIEAA